MKNEKWKMKNEEQEFVWNESRWDYRQESLMVAFTELQRPKRTSRAARQSDQIMISIGRVKGGLVQAATGS